MTGAVAKVEADRVTLKGCTFTEVEKAALPAVTAKDLVAAYARDPAAAGRRYGDLAARKQFILTGVVREVRDTRYSNKVVVLEPAGKLAVSVSLSREDAEGLKRGDAVKVKADCRGLGHSELAGQVLCDGVRLKDGPGRESSAGAARGVPGATAVPAAGAGGSHQSVPPPATVPAAGAADRRQRLPGLVRVVRGRP